MDELMDVASEPQDYNIYMATNFLALTQNVTNRLSDAVCNSTCNDTIVLHYCKYVCAELCAICVIVRGFVKEY